jgi:hypothetical protein
MVAFMSLMDHEAKNVSYLEDRLSRVALENELRLQFAAGDLCKNLLAGVTAPVKGDTSDIGSALGQDPRRAAKDQILHSEGNSLTYDRLSIKKIALEDTDLTAPASTGSANLVLYPERIRTGGGPSVLTPIKIKIALAVDTGYKIESCSGGGQGQGCPTGNLQTTAQVPAQISKQTCSGGGGGRGGGAGGGHFGGGGGGEHCHTSHSKLTGEKDVYVNGKSYSLAQAPAQVPPNSWSP